MSEPRRKAVAMVLWTAIIMTTGYGFMKLTTPTEAQIYERLSPALRKQFDNEKELRRSNNEMSLKQMFEQSKLDRPAWRTDIPNKMDLKIIPVAPGTDGSAGTK